MVYGILNLEKVEKSANPPLIVLGQVISEVLEILLANKGITEDYFANFMGTKNTSKPLAYSRGLMNEIYKKKSSRFDESFYLNIEITEL